MKPGDLLKTAKELVDATDGKPRQSNLKRAISTSYYALFHALAHCCADMMVGTSNAGRSQKAWVHVYRALDHGFAKSACQNRDVSKFPAAIQDFANMFVTMQAKRHDADYDPNTKVHKSAVLADLAAIEDVIAKLKPVAVKHRRAFAVWVLFKQR